MFGFFKKNKDQRNKDQRLSLTLDDVRLLTDGLFSENKSASIYVAHCGGFPVETPVTDRFSEYWELALFGDPENFSIENKVKAARFQLEEFIDESKSNSGFRNFLDDPQKERIIQVRNSIMDGSINLNTFEDLGIEKVAEEMLQVALKKNVMSWNTLLSR